MLLALSTVLIAVPQDRPELPAKPTPQRIVMVRASGDPILDTRRFAQGLSASALVGLPVCMLVEAELKPIQNDLLRRLPEVALVVVGEAPGGLGERTVQSIREPHELYLPGDEVVVASMHRGDQLEAAVEACRRRLPLLIADRDLVGQAERLGVRRAYRAAQRLEAVLPRGIEVVAIDSFPLRLGFLRDHAEPYVAVANIGASRSLASGTPLGAAALAAAHGGVLHVLDQEVEIDYAALKPRSPPDELAAHKAKNWLLGSFGPVGGSGETLVAVPQVGTGPGLSGLTPRWGDPILDLNGDGKLDAATETVAIGDVRRIGDRDWSISLRLIGAIGTTKFFDGMRTQRAVRIAPAAETIAAALSRVYGEAGVLPRSLLIAGDHREVPFDYVKDPVYARSIMHEQELASDNLYGDPDQDGHLDIAVGRFIASEPVQATALAARLATYRYWPRDQAPSATLIYPAWPNDEIELRSPMIFPSFEAFMRGVAADVEHAGHTTRLHLREDGELDRVLPSLPTSSLIVFAHHSGPDGWQFRIHRVEGKLQVDMLVPSGHSAEGKPGTAVPFLAGAPLIVGAGCDSAGLDYEVVFKNSIVHTFFEQGALGYVGNTRAGFPDTEEFPLRQMLQAALGMQPLTNGPLSIGESFRQGKNYFDLLIRTRGPFESVIPFQKYDLAMRREWTSLVYYGDPALRLSPAKPVTPTVHAVAFPDGANTIQLTCNVPMQSSKVWFMGTVAIGPLHEVTTLVAPGLSYSSVPWATYGATRHDAVVGPGTFVDVPIPPGVTGTTVALREGPDWAFGGARILTDARGTRRLLLSCDFVRYSMRTPDDAVPTNRIVLAIE